MGLETAFETVVLIRAIDAFTAPARKIAEQMGLVGAQAEALQAKLAGFKNMALIGGGITLAGGLMAKGLLNAADAAGTLQTSLMGVKSALKLNNDEYQKALNMSQTVGIPTIFSANEVGSIMQAMGTSGLSKNQVLNSSILQEYVDFADVQAQIKKENAPDVVSAAVKMAHQYQLYSTQQLQPFLNELNGALLHTNSTASEFGTTFKYISNQSRTMGMSAQDTLSITSWLDRMGLGNGRGGTNFADFLQRSIYHSSGAKADAAMVQAGFVKNGHSVFEDAKGDFVGIPEAVKIMQDFSKRFHGNANLMSPLLKDIFGTQGMRVAQLMTSSGAADQYTNVQKQIAGTESIEKTQEDLNNTWQGKTKQLTTTLQDLWVQFGFGVKAGLMPILSGLDDILAKVLKFAQTHPQIVKWVATFATIATAVMLVVGPMMLLKGVFGYLGASGMAGAGFKMFGSAIGGALGPITMLISAGYLLYQAWKTDFGGIREKSKAAFDWLKKEAPIAIAEIQKLAKSLGLEDAKGNFKMPEWLKLLMGGMVGGKIANSLFGGLGKMLGPLAGFFKGGKAGALLDDLSSGIIKLLTGESLGGNGMIIGAFKKLGSMGLKGLEGGAKALFGENTVNVAKFLGGKGLDLAKLLGGKGLDFAKFLGKGSIKGIKGIVNVLKPVGGLLKSGGKFALEFGGNLLKLGAQALVAAARMAASWVIGLGPVGWIIMGVIAVLALLWVAWKNNWGNIRQHVADAVAFIKAHWQQLLMFLGPAGWIIIGIVKLVQGIKNNWGTIKTDTAAVVKWIIDHFTEMIQWFENIPARLKKLGIDIVNGLLSGIQAGWKFLKTGWNDLVSHLPAALATKLQIHSPSRVMMEMGGYISQGLALGITNNASQVAAAAKQLSTAAVPGISDSGGIAGLSGTGAGADFDPSEGGGMIYIAPGAIVINPAPEQSPDEIAEAVLNKLGKKLRKKSYSSPSSVVSAWG